MSTARGTDVKPVSAQGLAVLRALAAAPRRWHVSYDGQRRIVTPAGHLRTIDLVRLLMRRGVSRGVARASLSRTVRRLWRAGFVELLSGPWHRTMTECAREHRAEIAALKRDPIAAYAHYQAFIAEYKMPDVHGSAAAYIAARQARAPDFRVTHVRITAAGRAMVNNGATTELTDDQLQPDSEGINAASTPSDTPNTRL